MAPQRHRLNSSEKVAQPAEVALLRQKSGR